MTKIKFVLLIFILGLTSCAKDIVDLTCSIEGVVKDEDSGTPLTNCEVQIIPSNNSITTASDGVYRFNQLESGEYTLTYNRSGYISDTRTVNLNAGETSKIEMLLKAKASFSLSENVYDFGDLESNKTFICFNNSASDCSYTISNLPKWILVNKTHGTIKASSNDSFTLTIDRTKVDIGNFNQNIIIKYSGHMNGTETLLIKMSKVEYTKPSVTTATSSSFVNENSFSIEGTITATGGSQITSYGHCWSSSENPTINDNCTNLGMTDKIGSFKSTVEDLLINTTYYVRAYATNKEGTSYGEQTIIKTLSTDSDIWNGQIASSFASGSGTAIDPYIIKTGGQLLLMKEYKFDYFKMDNDINLNNNNWLPIEFYGHFDGNGHTIYNLKISRDIDKQGLFSYLSGTVVNLKIDGSDINAPRNSNIGVLSGEAKEAIINNCEIIINKEISGNNYIGGFIGTYHGKNMAITNCKLSYKEAGKLKGNNYVGGLIGFIDNLEYLKNDNNNNNVNIDIEGEGYIGGCYGYVKNPSSINIFNHCYSGKIKGEHTIGGIIGYAGGAINIQRCKTNVDIKVANNSKEHGIGGILGDIDIYIRDYCITSCYSTGNISFSGKFGGIVDYDTYLSERLNFTIKHCYTTINDGINYKNFEECTSVYESQNVSQTMAEYHSNLANDWNYKHIWIWNGELDGEQVSISCPKLAWEK